jgi:hypothetical protein
MNTYDFVHLGLYAVGGQIKGKTKLQKTMYFLGRLTNHLDELGYGAYYYGPYSSEVAQAADRLRALGFLEQTVASGGAVDSRGFEVARYDFSLNEDGKKVAESKKNLHQDLWEEINEAGAKLREAGGIDYRALSIAAKTDFVLRESGGEATINEIGEVAEKFGWSVSKEEIQQAGDFLKKVGLVESAKPS